MRTLVYMLILVRLWTSTRAVLFIANFNFQFSNFNFQFPLLLPSRPKIQHTHDCDCYVQWSTKKVAAADKNIQIQS